MSSYGDLSYYYGDIGAYVLWDGAHVVRTADLQAASPVWEDISGTISGTVYDGLYVHIGSDSVGMWLLTSTAVYWCADILATTPSWSEVLTITTVRATAVAPTSGNVIFASMTAGAGAPGHLVVALSLDTENDDYLHAYYWVTENYGAAWTAVDMTAFTYGTSPTERCYYRRGRYAVASDTSVPPVVWCGASNGRTGTGSGDTALFKSTDGGYTWTLEHSFSQWTQPQANPALFRPQQASDVNFVQRGTGGVSSNGEVKLWRSTDDFDTVTQLTEPSGHAGGFENNNHLQPVTKRFSDAQHILALFQITSSSNADLYESEDDGATWTLLANLNNSAIIPNGWPPDPQQWVLIDNTDAPHIQLTLDHFGSLLDKTGNLASVITWSTAGIAGGFALPKSANPLSASLTTWFRVQAARQSSFGTAVEPTFALPVRFEYSDGDVDHIAEWGAGLWTGSEIVAQVAQFAEFRLSGTLFYELLPVFLAAGFAAMTPSGVGPYAYSGGTDESTPPAPVPYTFRFGGDEGSGGSLVQVADAYLRALTLDFNLNRKAVTFESQWFGSAVDDNSGAGYAPVAVSLPSGLRMVNGLLNTVGIQDAGASGGAFDALTDFACSFVEWQLEIDTGLRPAWASDQNGLTYCGVRHEAPTATLRPHIRTTADNYALVLTKAQARTFQELELSFAATNRAWVWQMTGRWLGKLNAHDRSRGEVVMKPTFQAATPATQTTTPHWASWSMDTGWEHE